MKHFIIEGPDGAGKTTYAQALCEQFGYEYHHEGPPPIGVNTFTHYLRLLERSKPTVFDRLHLGELVYGPLLRGSCGIDYEQCRYLSDKALVTVCLPPMGVCMKSLHEEEFIKSTLQLMDAYERWARLIGNAAFMHNAIIYDRSRTVTHVS